MSSSLDFLTRHAGASQTTPRPPFRFPAWTIPASIALGFGVLFSALFRDRLLPAREVETALVLMAAPVAGAGTGPETPGVPQPAANPLEAPMLFQASGWIEPDPLPVKATALIDGVVASVHVLEGQPVEKGQLLAQLVDDDAKLALEAARRRHGMLVSARKAHLATIDGAVKKRDSAEAEAVAANALGDEARDLADRFGQLPQNAVSRSEVNSAKLRVQRERSLLLAAQARTAELEAEVERLKLEAAAKDEEIALAAVEVEQAELQLARTRITAPITGRILRLLAAPGDKKMLAMDHAESSTVGILYDPAKLQVRVDVPLADAAGMRPGQKVRIHCGLLPDKIFSGEVTRITGEADVQRNTLQAKVRIEDPAGQLRPEMLCRAEFLASGGGEKTDAESLPPTAAPAQAIWVHARALQGNAAWVFDPESSRVSRRDVETTSESRDGYVRIKSGLRPGEHTVLSPEHLREGQRVKPTTVSHTK